MCINIDFYPIYVPEFDDPGTAFYALSPCDEAKEVQRIAPRKDLSFENPLMEMLKLIPNWKETIIDFEDRQQIAEIWLDLDMSFTDLKARQMRRRERGYMRWYYGGSY
jgi:hypothetical protein